MNCSRFLEEKLMSAETSFSYYIPCQTFILTDINWTLEALLTVRLKKSGDKVIKLNADQNDVCSYNYMQSTVRLTSDKVVLPVIYIVLLCLSRSVIHPNTQCEFTLVVFSVQLKVGCNPITFTIPMRLYPNFFLATTDNRTRRHQTIPANCLILFKPVQWIILLIHSSLT